VRTYPALGVWLRALGKLDDEDPVAVIVVSVDDGLPTWFGNWEQKTRLVVVHERDGSHEER